MSKIEKALYELNSMEQASQLRSPLHALDSRVKLIVTFLYLICMLSLPLKDLSRLILFCLYPIITCAMAGIGYGTIFKRSLIVLPFVFFIGIFNPILDRQVVFSVGNVNITAGWISFISILLRGILSAQAVFLLIYSTGFYNVCRGMQHLGIPALLTTQLLFVYRYIFVLLQEALNMHRARVSRSFGRKSYPFKMWGIFIGQLLIRTVERSQRIHRAMLSRGFSGSIKSNFHPRWRVNETFYLTVWGILFIGLRVFHSISFLSISFHP
nr:cobalt ECF transporter T component CbiQ [uncultured Bacteroides sp.]